MPDLPTGDDPPPVPPAYYRACVPHDQRHVFMDNPESRRMAAALAHAAGSYADAGRIADAIIALLQAIDAALSPVLGQRGVAALYKRSLHLASAAHPWLADLHEGAVADMDLPALKSVLAQQGSENAAGGGGALLHTYYQLLTSLIGPSLTERLLHAVRQDFFSRAPAQDTSP